MRRYNTIIFVPHGGARFRKLTVSSRLLALFSLLTAILLIAAVAFGWAFFASAQRDQSYRLALTENARLKQKAERLTQRLEGLARQMEDFETRTKRLAIVAGLADLGRRGLGGPFADRSSSLESQLSVLERQFARRSALASSTPTVSPVRGLPNSGFGFRRDPFTGSPAFHYGLDISTQWREPVLATAEGIILKSGWSGDYGKAVEIAHGSGYRTIYGHLDQIIVREGERVRRGQLLGLVGSTGRSTAPHLHYEVRHGERLVDPLQYILDLDAR